jgi:transposase
MLHAHKLKLRDNTGEGNPRKILSECEVMEIYNRCYEGARVCDLADEYGVSRPTISDIKAKRNWQHILQGLPDINHKSKKQSLSENTVRWVCSELQKGTRMTDILKQSTNQLLTIDKIYDIKRRRSFLWVSKDYNF